MLTAGVDEAGRGPLAGPVVAAAVILDTTQVPLAVKDSKKLSESRREELYEKIYTHAVAVGVGSASVDEIDSLNILNASLLAMRRAILKLEPAPQRVLVDGNRCPEVSIDCEAIIGGDDKVLSISAASIIAKVTRDRIMITLHDQYPEYGFGQHKGYPTKIHREALMTHGPIDAHRRSFGPVKLAIENDNAKRNKG